MESGKGEINEKMDKSPTYVWTMRGLDIVGILGVGGAFKDIMETRDALDASGVGWRRAMSGPISRPQRRVITKELGLLANKRVAAPLIGAVVKQRLLAAVAAAIGMGSSAAIGATHDLIIWVSTPSQGQ
jgi:hypothetical protein